MTFRPDADIYLRYLSGKDFDMPLGGLLESGPAAHVLWIGRLLLSWLAYFMLVAFLPFHAWWSEGAHSEAMNAAASTFGGELLHSVYASPFLAAGGIGALIVVLSDLYNRYAVAHRLEKGIDLLNEYFQIYDSRLDSEIAPLLIKLSSGTLDDPGYTELKRNINLLLATMCTMIADTFSEVTHNKCCATLKIYDQDTGLISTKMRDSNQHRNRTSVDGQIPSFPYSDNTAFAVIVEGNKSSYVTNYLPLLSLCGKYVNKRADWYQRYAATAVVPVALPTEGGMGRLVGFICVDNFGGRFPKASTSLLQSYVTTAHKLLEIAGKARKDTP